MIFPKFIEFFEDLKSAIDCRFSVNTVHLKPNSNERYSFVLPLGYNVANLYLINQFGLNEELFDWELKTIADKTILYVKNITHDDWEFVNLYVVSGDNPNLFSTKFRVSSIDLERTTIVQFRSNKWSDLGAIRLNLFKVQNKRSHENTTYYQITKERTISTGAKRNYTQKYHLENVHIDSANALIDVLTLPIIYFDGVRTYVNELPELEDLQGGENFISSYFIVNKNENDTIDTGSSVLVGVLGHKNTQEILGNEIDNQILGNNGN